jgi:hypothetical protein
MKAFKTALVISIAAFLIGSAFAAPGLDLVARPLNRKSTFKFSNAHMADRGIPIARADRAPDEPDAPTGYAPLGIAKINGQRIAVYAFQNGARLDDAAGQGSGSADVFDSSGHLIRRFIYRENLNSPPQVDEFIYMPER